MTITYLDIANKERMSWKWSQPEKRLWNAPTLLAKSRNLGARATSKQKPRSTADHAIPGWESGYSPTILARKIPRKIDSRQIAGGDFCEKYLEINWNRGLHVLNSTDEWLRSFSSKQTLSCKYCDRSNNKPYHHPFRRHSTSSQMGVYPIS